jgi:hypothetical protein
MASNWDSFIPDILVGLFTGLVVGAALLIAQAIAQSRKYKADSKFAWESLKPNLSAAAHQSWSMDSDSLLPAPAALTSLHEIASREPLALWQSHLKEPDPALDLVMNLNRLRAAFESSAARVEAALGVALLRFNGTAFDVDALGRLVRARAYGTSDAEALDTISRMRNPGPAEYVDVSRTLAAEPRLEAALAQFREVSEIYVDLISRLRSLLNPEEAA